MTARDEDWKALGWGNEFDCRAAIDKDMEIIFRMGEVIHNAHLVALESAGTPHEQAARALDDAMVAFMHRVTGNRVALQAFEKTYMP